VQHSHCSGLTSYGCNDTWAKPTLCCTVSDALLQIHLHVDAHLHSPAWLPLLFLETGSCYAAQAGLEPLGSGILPKGGSQRLFDL
jgi:hypothetical protein